MVLVEENLILVAYRYEGEIMEDLFFIEYGNLYIKIGNLENKKLYISLYREAIVITNFKNELRSSIHMKIKIPEVLDLYDINRKLQLLLDML